MFGCPWRLPEGTSRAIIFNCIPWLLYEKGLLFKFFPVNSQTFQKLLTLWLVNISTLTVYLSNSWIWVYKRANKGPCNYSVGVVVPLRLPRYYLVCFWRLCLAVPRLSFVWIIWGLVNPSPYLFVVTITNIATMLVNATLSKLIVPKGACWISAWFECSASIACPSSCHTLVNYV